MKKMTKINKGPKIIKLNKGCQNNQNEHNSQNE